MPRRFECVHLQAPASDAFGKCLCFSEFAERHQKKIRQILSYDMVRQAVRHTPFQHEKLLRGERLVLALCKWRLTFLIKLFSSIGDNERQCEASMKFTINFTANLTAFLLSVSYRFG